MDNLFIPYELTVKLKELGFTKFESFKYYSNNKGVVNLCIARIGTLPAPLYQQAFDWFREVYNLDATIRKVDLKDRSYWSIKKIETEDKIKGYASFTTSYEKAKIECIKKLIELI
jgi:hypothetical protein